MFELLKNICEEKVKNLDEKYKKRLAEELTEINSQNQAEYFLSIKEKHNNDNNLLVPHLLGICDNFNIEEAPVYDYGDMPDIDIDYIPSVRKYLKENYAREQFGEDYVCNIATYTTFGLRSALIDMARVFDLDRKEILALTTRLGIKDDEGEILTWDKAIEIYDELREYLERNPEMADAAKRLLNRIRNTGMHASGLIISNVPIKDFVPLVRVRNNAQACSAWVEGLHGTDLGAVGLVKFDFLGLESNLKIAQASKMAVDLAENMVEKSISALPGRSNWTDLRYLDDKKCMEMANKGDLKMIFQYDGSEGIRRLAKQGGVDTFEDLAAYTAIFRPSCLKLKMHETYCKRKRGEEIYEIPEQLKFLEKTYGVLIYQEDTLRLLNVMGKIPMKDCEMVRKAISKKNIDKFKQYKETFIKNGMEVMNKPKEYIEHWWNLIESWGGYGFNRAHTMAYGYISARMLYLKAHHPLAFYTSVLNCTTQSGPKDYLKLKDYKQEACRHSIKVNPININISKQNITAHQGEIYWGFAKLRSIGESIAEKIEKHQPFANYEDFLKRVGTDSKANLAVLSLQLFPGDPIEHYYTYEATKLWNRRQIERNRRFTISMTKYKKFIESISKTEFDFSVEQFNEIKRNADCQFHRKLDQVWQRITKAQNNYKQRSAEHEEMSPQEIKPVVIKPEIKKLLLNKAAAEEFFYGFIWNHPIEKCKHYNHHTFEQFQAENYEIGPIDVMIKNVKEMKGPKVTYYGVDVEDGNGQNGRVNVWKSDYEVFKELLVKNKFVRMSVKAPNNGYSTYSIASERNKKNAKIHSLD